MNELNICADDYVDQIDFIFKYWLKKPKRLVQ